MIYNGNVSNRQGEKYGQDPGKDGQTGPVSEVLHPAGNEPVCQWKGDNN